MGTSSNEAEKDTGRLGVNTSKDGDVYVDKCYKEEPYFVCTLMMNDDNSQSLVMPRRLSWKIV